MGSVINFKLPAKGTIKVSLNLIFIVLIVGISAQLIGGTSASVVVGLAAGSAMTFGTFLSKKASVVVTMVLGLAAALGALAYGNPLLAALAVALMVFITAPANAYSAGILMLAPLLTMLFVVTDRGFTWWQAGIWGIIGGITGIIIITLMKFDKQPPKPVPWNIAWRHSLILAVVLGICIYITEKMGAAHGYWIAVTLLVAVRPDPSERMSYVIQRVWGTLLGALIALFTLWLLPINLLMPAALLYLVALAAYAMSGNYFMQTMFLTPMLMIFLSSGETRNATFELTLGRVYYTVIGVCLAVAVAWMLAEWEKFSNKTAQ